MKKIRFILIMAVIIFVGSVSYANSNDFTIHETSDFEEWANMDHNYVSEISERINNGEDKEKIISLLIDENLEIHQELGRLSGNYVEMSNGAKLYSLDTTGWIHALNRGASYRREILEQLEEDEKNIKLSFDEKSFFHYTGVTSFKIVGRTPLEGEDDIARETIEILGALEDYFQDDFFTSISVFISPYTLDNALGYATLHGGEHHIVLSPRTLNLKTMRNTILHEIGHVFHRYLGISKERDTDFAENVWKEYLNIYEGKLLDSNYYKGEWEIRPEEHFAEDFKEYFWGKVKDRLDWNPEYDSTRKVAFAYNKTKFSQFIEKYIESEIVQKKYPELTLRIGENNIPLNLNNKLYLNKDKNVELLFKEKYSSFDNYSIRIENENSHIDILNISISNIRKLSGENIKTVLICLDENELRLIRWTVVLL